MASLDSSIVIISLVTAVLVVTFGRIGDMFGRVRMYNAGFAIFTLASFALVDFSYPMFAALLLANGIGFGLFTAPNTTGIMNAAPARARGGAASDMRATFQNGGQLLSIGLFVSLLAAGLSCRCPGPWRRRWWRTACPPRSPSGSPTCPRSAASSPPCWAPTPCTRRWARRCSVRSLRTAPPI
jgi:MFS family permease